MDGTEIVKRVLTDSRFWAALWVFLQIPLNYLASGSEFGQQLLSGANVFVASLMAIVFTASTAARVGREAGREAFENAEVRELMRAKYDSED